MVPVSPFLATRKKEKKELVAQKRRRKKKKKKLLCSERVIWYDSFKFVVDCVESGQF